MNYSNTKTKKIIAREILIIFSIPILILIVFLFSSGWDYIIEFRVNSYEEKIRILPKEIKELKNNIEFKAPYLNGDDENNTNLKLQIKSKREKLNIARTKKRELPYFKTDLKFNIKQIIYIFFIIYLIRISWFLISWSIKQLKK